MTVLFFGLVNFCNYTVQKRNRFVLTLFAACFVFVADDRRLEIRNVLFIVFFATEMRSFDWLTHVT